MKPEELEIGAMYFYQGDALKWANVTYMGQVTGFYGTGYVFAVETGGFYTLSPEGLADLCYPSSLTVTTQPATIIQ